MIECPNCSSNNTDHGNGEDTVGPHEASIDFICLECGSQFSVTYSLISINPCYKIGDLKDEL